MAGRMRDLIVLSTFAACTPAPERLAQRTELAKSPPASSVQVAPAVELDGDGSARRAPEPDARDAGAPPNEEEYCSEASFVQHTAALRKALELGDRKAALDEVDQALAVHPRDVELWTRRAELLRQSGASDKAALCGRVLLDLAEGKSALGWLLVGLGADAGGDQEQARAAFARSALLDPKGEGATRLGSRSTCTAGVGQAASRYYYVNGWRGAFKALNEGVPVPKNDALAKQKVCVESFLGEVRERNVCRGKGPWQFGIGGIGVSNLMLHIEPLPGNRFFLTMFTITGSDCAESDDVRATRLSGDILQVEQDVEQAILSEQEFHACDAHFCPKSQLRRTTYYDTKSAKVLLVLEEPDETEHRVFSGRKLVRSGPAGCQETLNL